MSGTRGTTSRWARARRRFAILLAVLAVGLPIPVGLVLAWQVHWLLVVPAYLLGIPVWLSLVSGSWALVRRVLPGRAPAASEAPAQEPAPVAAPADTPAPGITTELRLPAPRGEARVEGTALRTPTP